VKSAILTFTPLMAAISWTIALIVDPAGLGPASVLLIGLGLLSMATVAVVGMILSGGLWARRLAFGVILACMLVATVRPIDPMWYVSLALTAVALAAMLLPSVTSRLRKLPSTSGPPPMSVLTPMVLLAAPFIIGLTAVNATPWAMIVVGLGALVSAFAYARVIPGGLFAVRILWPATAIGLSPLLGVPAGIESALLGIVVGGLAWHHTVKVAFHPPTETGTTYAIPPELAPQEVLDTAHIDDHGQPR